jgi:hypothetical protein
MAATDFVLDADTGYDVDELPPVLIRIDGEVYKAHCPKDSLPVLMSRLQGVDLEDEPGVADHLVRQIMLSIFTEEDTTSLMDRLLDMQERKITLAYLIHVVRMVADHYERDLEAHYTEMGMDNPLGGKQVPANRAARRHPANAVPAKKAAAKKTAARKTAPR